MSKKRKWVGSRELKTRLGSYLDAVKRGEVIVVTEHGQPVAELRPIGDSDDALEVALRRMADEGLVTRPIRESTLTPFTPIKLPPGTPSIAQAISQDREDRF
jgi:prevent-host-death family protein